MSSKLTLVLTLSLLCCSSLPTLADDPQPATKDAVATTLTPEKKALILELLKITDADKSVDQIVKTMMDAHQRQYPAIMAQVINSDVNISEEQKKQLIDNMQENSARSAERMRELFLSKINLGDVLNEVALVVYDKNFSNDELKDIIMFYKTKTGKKSLQVMPQVLKESMDMTSKIITPKMQAIIKQLMQEERTRLQAPAKTPEKTEAH